MRWAVAGVAVGLTALPAWGEGAVPARQVAVDGGAPSLRPPHAFVQACARGAAQYAAHDFAAAADSFRGAIDLYPTGALGPYLLGEALFASGDVAGAEEAWNRAATASEADPPMHGRVLFVVAAGKERQKKWNDAKAAWEAYRAWAAAFPLAPAYVASAESRSAAIEKMLAQERAAEGIRKRIADSQDGGVFTDPAKGDAGT